MTSKHQIICRDTGRAIADKLDGGYCRCGGLVCLAFPYKCECGARFETHKKLLDHKRDEHR